MALGGFCQNRNCKKEAMVVVNSGIEVVLEEKDGVPTVVGQRRLCLCVEDSAYFLEFRDDPKQKRKVEAFVSSCHKD